MILLSPFLLKYHGVYAALFVFQIIFYVLALLGFIFDSMRQSLLFTKTRKEAPSDEVSKNAQLLIRLGYLIQSYGDSAGSG